MRHSGFGTFLAYAGKWRFDRAPAMRSALGLCVMVVLSLHAGGSVPDDLRRYLTTAQDVTLAVVQQAVAAGQPQDWQSVGRFVVRHDLLAAMSPKERALIRVAYQQEIIKAKDDNAIRQSIRMPVLPGPVVAPAPIPAPRFAENTAAPAATPPAPKSAAAQPKTPSPLAEDLATIEALKTALQDLRKEGLQIGTYRNDMVN